MITAIQLQLVRDWTWDSLNDTGFEVRRNLGNNGDELIGTLAVPRSVSALAVRPELGIDRSTTDLVFFDAMNPMPAAGAFPAETMVTYTVTPRFKQVPITADWPWQSRIRLPIAVPPTQVPRLVSAGIAFSPYRHDSTYSSTESRRRMLWFEFAEPVQNPRDAYFLRVLAQAADPLLVGAEPDQPPAPIEPPLPVDPELIRIITPGQSDDSAGLDAMQRLTLSAGDSARHFLIPLPPNLPDTAPELFGFFTYEVRIGHAQGWSTAQARFGLPLRVTGVQHPMPPLTCSVSRQAAGITASAPFALPVANGQVLLSQRPFQTQIWILLYAQVLQANGASWRNVLLGQAPAQFQAKTFEGQTGPQPHGVAHWEQADILRRLAALNLSADAPLSVLAVEFLQEPSAAFADPLGADLGQARILRTSPLTPVNAICIDVVAQAADGGTNMAQVTVSDFGARLGGFADPAGDDNGPGSYVYPTNPVYVPGAFDLTALDVFINGTEAYFVARIRGEVTNPFGGDQISLQRLNVYLGSSGGNPVPALPGTNLNVAAPWSVVIVGDGRFNQAGAYAPDGTKLANATLIAVPETHQIAVGIPLSALNGLDLYAGT